MRNRLLPILCVASVGLAAIPSLVQAHPAQGAPQAAQQRHEHEMGMFQFLNLTQDQKNQLKAIRQKYADQTKTQHQALEAKRKDLFDYIKRADATKDQALAKQREIQGLQAQLAESRLNAWFEGRAVLSADQLKKLESFKPQGFRGHHPEGQD